jgi:phosphoserine phosphatase
MEGRIPFRESLGKRLALVRPPLAAVRALGEEAVSWLTPGMEGLLGEVEATVWLLSGGIAEALLPVARRLGIPSERVLASRARWSPAGELSGVEAMDKVEALRARAPAMERPRVLVGDGMTDYEPFRAGLVDHFVAFTGNVRRAAVVATGAPEAASVDELRYLLARLL